MGSAREEILSRIRAASGARAAPVPRDYDQSRKSADPAGLFAERVGDYQAAVHRVSEEELPGSIREILTGRGFTTLAAPADLPGEWRVDTVRWRLDEPPLELSVVDSVDGVLTGCAVAIAETGTIVLDAGVQQGRRLLTLVPDYHLCVVRARQIEVSVPEALRRLAADRPLTFVSGPSATSDIELDRVEGVHGPRTLEVLVVDA